jgi:competence protein ComEC
MIALGGLILVLWQGRGRIVGLLPLLAGFLIWANTERPDILISENGALLGIMTVEGRALSRGKGSGFVAQNWLENDGDAADQVGAAKRWALLAPEALPVRALRGKSAFASRVDCGKALVLVATVDPPEGIAPGLGCELLHPARLRRSGAIALYQTETGFRMRTAREVTGTRLWNVQ